MRFLNNLSLRSRLIASVLPVLAVSIIVLTAISYHFAANGILAQQYASMEMLVRKTVAELDTWIADRERDVQLLSADSLLQGALRGQHSREVEALLKGYHRLSPVYENVFLATPEGRIIFDSIGGKSLGVEIGKLQQFKANVEQARKGQIWVGDVQRSPATGRPVALITAPVLDQNRVVGILGTPIELQTFSDAFISQTRIGKSGYLYVLDETGLALAHPEKEAILKVNFAKQDWGRVLLEKKSASWHYTMEGVSKTGYFATSFKKGWIVGATVSDADLYESVRSMQRIIWGLGILLVVSVSGMIWFLTRKILSIVERVANTLSSGADEMTKASRQVFTSGESLAASVTEQAAALQETSASVEELTASVRKNAENAINAQKASASSTKAANIGKTAVADTIRTIEEINKSNIRITTEVENNNRDIANIEAVISKIAEKTKVIDDIVFQTKLLSFNASVEAARAGESGKGFAVVAEEVGTLARMSGNAAKEIAAMLADSKKRVADIARSSQEKVEQLVQLGRAKVAEGVTVAHKCGETLDLIVANVGEVNQLIEGVATASNEQARGISEIAKAVSEMGRANEKNAGAAQEAATASMGLSTHSEIQRKAADELSCLVNGMCSQMATMDFKAAIGAHVDWKIKLQKYLANPDNSLNPAVVGQDNACSLGKWVCGEGSQYQGLPEYASLRKKHAQFHRCVSEIITLANAGQREKAMALMSPGGQFLALSEATVGEIRQLEKIVKAA